MKKPSKKEIKEWCKNRLQNHPLSIELMLFAFEEGWKRAATEIRSTKSRR